MNEVGIRHAKTHLSKLVGQAANGEPFISAEAGKPLVKVAPSMRRTNRRLRAIGGNKAISRICGGFACAALLLVALGSSSTSALAEQTSGKAAVPTAAQPAITNVLTKYFAALDASDASAMLELYSDDGVFLQLFRPTAVGKAAVKRAYDQLFKNEKMDVTFKIAEVLQIAPDWAIARTSTEGPALIKATGVKMNDPTQELFVLKKAGDGEWRIARFSFSPTVSPAR